MNNSFNKDQMVKNSIKTKIEAEKFEDLGIESIKDSESLTLKKKEKRNRKYFLKRSILLVSISKQTGNIEFYQGSDFLHIEIMQGGHLPLNQYNLKEVKQETFSNDQDCLIDNLEKSLKCASIHLKKTIKEQLKCYDSPFCFTLLSQQRYISKEKQNDKSNKYSSFDCKILQNVNPPSNQTLKDLKETLKQQYFEIQTFLE